MTESVYINLWKKLHDGPQTAPADAEGNPQPSFMKHLELCYTPEEAELLQHMDRPGRFMSTREVADRAFAGITPDEIGIGISAAKLSAVLEDLFKTGGPMNIGMPFKTMIPTNLTEDITPGFAYLKKISDEKMTSLKIKRHDIS